MSSRRVFHLNIEEYTRKQLEGRICTLYREADWDDPAQCAMVVIGTSALWAEQALGLSWGDLDLAASKATIANVCNGSGLHPAGSPREWSLSAESASALRRLLLTLGASPAPGDPVFRSADGSRLGRRELAAAWARKRGDFCMSRWTLDDLRNICMVLFVTVDDEAVDAEGGR